MYLWEILNRDKSELINRVYSTQQVSNNIGDWIRLVEADRVELGLGLTDIEIQGVSKLSFKTFVKKKVTRNFLLKLEGQKNKHSKSKFLSCKELKMAEYMKNPTLSTQEKTIVI